MAVTGVQTCALPIFIFTAGKDFDNLRCDRQSTHAFITTGALRGITSRSDLELLRDLSDATEALISFHNSGTPLTPEVIIAINKAMTRWGALHPGQLRREHDIFGVPTRFGDHRPPAADEKTLQTIIDSVSAFSPAGAAANLFVALAKAQPFGDGNKRTALLAANLLVLPQRQILTVPFREDDPTVSDRFNELLARAYIFGEVSPCVNYMTTQGVISI